MPASTRKRISAAPELRPRLRVQVGAAHAMGPGKADLLESIEARGSLADAARELGMSYMRAWHLVGEMNEAFRQPLVELRRGAQGGATLTGEGRIVLALYREMDAAARRAAAPAWRRLRRRLRESR